MTQKSSTFSHICILVPVGPANYEQNYCPVPINSRKILRPVKALDLFIKKYDFLLGCLWILG